MTDQARETIKQNLDIVQSIIVIIGLPFAIAGLFFNGIQTKTQVAALEETRKVESARFVLDFNNALDGPRYEKIITAIEGHDQENHSSDFPILRKPGGKFFSKDIDDYISQYDDIGMLYIDGLIDQDMAYNDFSYSVEKAYCNKDIWNHIIKYRKNSHNLNSLKAYYRAFEDLAKTFFKMDQYKCSDLDNQ